MSDKLKLGWGRQPPEGTTVAWGARAIFHPPAVIDLLHDRQAAIGSPEERKQLHEVINGSLLPGLREALQVAADEGRPLTRLDKGERVMSCEAEGYRIEACTNGSHGYLYICAFPTPEEAP